MAKAYYTETDSSGMQHLLAHIKELSDEASKHGAALIASQKGERESGQALSLRQNASTATLRSVVHAVGDAVESILKQAAVLLGEDPDEVSYIPNTEFSDGTLDGQQLKSITEAYLNNTISLETLLDNFRKAGILQDGETVETEHNRVKEKQAEIDAKLAEVTMMEEANSDVEYKSSQTANDLSNKVKLQDSKGREYSGKD